MAVEVKIPPMGESISSVVVGRWLAALGDLVKEGDILVELETDKVNVEVPSPVSGELTRILKKPGETAALQDVLALIEEAAAVLAPRPSPAAQRLLEEKRIPESAVEGSGKHGQILKEDVLRQAAPAVPPAPPASAPAPAAPPPPPAVAPALPATASLPPTRVPETPPSAARRDEAVAMTPLRKTVARRLVEAQQTAALLTTFNEVDMGLVMELRQRYQEEFQAKHGVKLGFMSFFVKAAVEALKAFPAVNAEIRQDQIVFHHYYDIGVAVGGGKGLVVPILRNADRLSLADIEKSIKDFGARAQSGKLKLEELQGGTFTLSNGGVYGSLLSTPIVNPPQSGVLGLHKIQERPVALQGQVVIRPMMYLALTYDHRLVDGREAVSFLIRVKECVENPTRMLLEI